VIAYVTIVTLALAKLALALFLFWLVVDLFVLRQLVRPAAAIALYSGCDVPGDELVGPTRFD
jgi:hypothetical protein